MSNTDKDPKSRYAAWLEEMERSNAEDTARAVAGMRAYLANRRPSETTLASRLAATGAEIDTVMRTIDDRLAFRPVSIAAGVWMVRAVAGCMVLRAADAVIEGYVDYVALRDARNARDTRDARDARDARNASTNSAAGATHPPCARRP